MIVAGIDMSGMLLSIAAKLAHGSADEQAAFFNIFAKELTVCCETSYNADMQASYVADKSSPEFKQFCGTISYEE